MSHYPAFAVADPGDTNPRAELTYFYRPQCSCGKVMFSQVSVILFTGGGGVGVCGRHPWADTP